MVSNAVRRIYKAKCFLIQLGGLIVVVALMTGMAFVHGGNENGWTCSSAFKNAMRDLNSLYHLLGFSAFGFILSALSARGLGRSTLSVVAVTLVIGTIFGIAIEVAQPFAGRTCDIADMAVDLVGVVLGIVVWVIILSRAAAKRTTVVS